MKLESFRSAEDKGRWKVVRLDTFVDVPGQIISADEETGKCTMCVTNPDGGTRTEEFDYGPRGISLCRRN